MSSIASACTLNEPTSNPEEGDIFGPVSGWDDETEELEAASVDVQELKRELDPEDREAIGRIRAFGVSMCNLVMRTLPQIPEEIVKRCLRTLTTTPLESIDPNVFVDVEEEV